MNSYVKGQEGEDSLISGWNGAILGVSWENKGKITI
jgi:hypothetical protein